MAKTYGHAVIYNGVFYPANVEIKDFTEKENTTEKAVAETAKIKKRGVK